MIFAPVRNLSNGTKINGVEHIYQTTKPTTRVDGSALVIGDRWYKKDNCTEWRWNGLYWESHLLTFNGNYVAPSAASALGAWVLMEKNYPVIVKDVCVRFTLASGTLSGSLYWFLQLIDTSSEIGTITYNITSGDSGETTGTILKTVSPNNYYPLTANNASVAFLLQRNTTGTTIQSVGLVAQYNLVYP